LCKHSSVTYKNCFFNPDILDPVLWAGDSIKSFA
jgi:hypothetical protein